MLQTLKLLVPALIPSWRFFDTIAPSPRIEFTLLKTAQEEPAGWQEFRPRPPRLSLGSLAKRLFWNPQWNESLFLVSCAERLITNPTENSRQEILRRIRAGIEDSAPAMPYLQYRLVFVSRNGEEIQKEILFVSPVHGMAET